MRPILFEIGPLRVYGYGFFIALGGLASILFWLGKRRNMGLAREEQLWVLVNLILLSGLVGGKLLFLAEYARPPGREFWSMLLAWGRGFSVLGAFAGVTAAVYGFARHYRLSFLRVLDYVSAAAPLWHFFGRLGCFAAGCCYGKPALGAWSVSFANPGAMVPAALREVPLHPVQLYEAAGSLALAAGLYTWVLPRVESHGLPYGSVSGAYFVGYGLFRFSIEFLRGDSVPFLGVTAGQGLSLLLILGGAALLRAARS